MQAVLPWIATSISVVSIAFIPLVLLRKKDPPAAIAWILALVFLPAVGLFLFWFLGRDRVRRPVRERKQAMRQLADRISVRLSGQFDALALERELHAQPDPNRGVMLLASKLAKMDIVPGNDLRLLVGAEPTYDALVEAIGNARDHVHLEYYVFRADGAGKRVVDALVAAAERGVRVRLLYDGYGSVGLRRRLKRLIAAGGYAAPFFPLSFIMRAWTINLRNHRKLVVIDGEVGFAGGINVGDMFVDWRDLHLRIEGPVVAELQAVFVADWFLATKFDLVHPAFFPAVEPRGSATLQIIQSGPDETVEAIHRLYFAAIASAQERVFVTTPYFVPDKAISVALQTAALRGVEVRLIVPRRSNYRLTLYAGRSFYDELLAAGVHVHEYLPGMLHTKAMVVDGRFATVGSANLDVRSFRLNFELIAVMFDPPSVRELERIFAEDLKQTEEVQLSAWRERPISTRMLEGAGRLLSPLL